jgi:uncharacterized repeat protein (TIGR01451 family)
MFVLLAPAAAHADRPFAIRYTANDFGAITFAANTVMTCPDSALSCANARLGLQGGSLGNNNGYAMTYVDVDGLGSTFNSSTATLSLPQDAFVLFAGLYWAGDTSAGATVGTVRGAAAPTPASRGTVLMRVAGATAYGPPVSAATLDSNGTRFSGFADVTDAVRQAGPGAYTVANIQSGTGGDRYGAWDLVVAYRDPTQPARNLTVFDGLATISQSTPVATLSLSGFTTPPSGPVRSVVGLISSEGDRTATGDSASLNSRAVFDDLNPPDNVFNSSMSQLGVRFSDKVPDYVNQLGSDANSFPTDGYLANGATSATIRLTTGGETYYPSVVFFTTEIYSPELRPAKSVVDVNGGAPERGDVLEYTVRLTNTGQDAATGLRFFDPVAAHSTYVPGSLAVTPVGPGATCPAFPPGAGPTDAPDGDQAEFDPAANRAVYRLGTGASGDASGRLDPGETVCVRLRVTIDPDAPLGGQVVNQGAANFFGETLGTPFPDVVSNEAALTVSGADLVPTKTHAGGAFVAGQSYDFSIAVRNAGDIATDGSTVTVSDAFPAAAFSSVNGAAGSGWICTPLGLAVTCTRSDALAAGQTWPPITVNATVADPAPATIVNTAEVAGGGDVDSTNDSTTDAGGAVAQADLALTKVSDVTTTPARRDVTFSLEVTNRGPSTASAVELTDTLAPNFEASDVTSTRGTCTTGVVCQLGSLAPGQVATITIVARVQDGAADSTATNTATAHDTGGSSDPVPGNDSASVDITTPPTSDMQLKKSVSPAEPQAGEPVTFTIPVTNAGPSVANNVILTDAIPSEIVFGSIVATFDGGTCVPDLVSRLIRCERASLDPDETAIVVINATLTPDSRGKTVLNSVQALSDSVDPQPELAKDTVAFVPIPAVDLELTKVALNPPAPPGGIARFGVQVANHGPSDAPDVVVRDTLPPGLSFVSDTRGACSADGAAVTCLLGELASGAAIDDWQIEVRVDPSLAGKAVRNAASIASEPADPILQPTERIPSSNEDAAELEVAQTADLRLTKSVTPATVPAGGEVTYTIRATNDGPGEATAVRVVDAIPDGLTVRSATATQGSCDASAAIVCDLGALASGAAAEVRVTAGVGADRAGSAVVNVATVDAAEVDLDQADNRASATLTVVPASGALSRAPECLADVLRLVDVAAGPTRVHLAGETARANAGRTVTLLFRGRRVGTATVATDGTFAATVPLPPLSVRTSNRTRYQAVLGSLRSLNLKLARRMRATELSSSAGTVTIDGRVTSPLARPVRTVTLRQYKDCRGTDYLVVKRNVKVSASGRFRTTVPAPAGQEIAYYRALTRVRKTTRNPKTYETFTLIRGVTIRPG